MELIVWVLSLVSFIWERSGSACLFCSVYSFWSREFRWHLVNWHLITQRLLQDYFQGWCVNRSILFPSPFLYKPGDLHRKNKMRLKRYHMSKSCCENQRGSQTSASCISNCIWNFFPIRVLQYHSPFRSHLSLFESPCYRIALSLDLYVILRKNYNWVVGVFSLRSQATCIRGWNGKTHFCINSWRIFSRLLKSVVYLCTGML